MITNHTLPESLRQWLHDLNVYVTPSPAGVLMNHGVLAASADLAPEPVRGPARECFTNSMRALATLLPTGADWRYCEGYAFRPKWGAPIEHAWLIDPSGRVWETTWPDVDDATYLGLPFDPWDIVEALGESQESLLFGDWSRDFQLLESHRVCCPGARATTRPGSPR